jgi:4-amino-4-deoxy-L-arabinose transferase-like glycosyltransferase
MPRALAAAITLSLLLHGALHATWSLTRHRRFSHDSMNYVDVARHVLAGEGISQGTIFYNPPHALPGSRFPHPATVQPPLYPLLIAAVSLFGPSPADAALLIPSLAFVPVLGLAFALVRRLHGTEAALAAVLLLALSYPLARASSTAWSEAPAILFALLSVCLAVHEPASRMAAFLAGVAAAAAFATRYVLAVSLPLGLLAMLEPRDLRKGLARGLACVLGFVSIAVPLVARNVAVSGAPFGEARNASPFGLASNLASSVSLLAGSWLGARDAGLQAAVLMLLLLVALAAGRRGLRERFLDSRRFVLPAWAAGYVLFVVAARSVQYFDLDARMLSPAHVFLMLTLGAGLGALARGRARLVGAVVVAVFVWKAAALAKAIVETRPANEARDVRTSPRLLWARGAVGQSDLVIGDNTVDLAFYLRKNSISFYSFPPLRQYLTHPDLCAVLAEVVPRFRHVYVLLRVGPDTVDQRREDVGPFVAELLGGRLLAYPNLRPIERLSDAVVLGAEACAMPGSGR